MKLKQVLVLLVFALFSYGVQAQDLIVTHENDSLNCKITRIKSGYIYFVFSHNGETRQTLLPEKQVKYYQYGFYQAAKVNEIQVKKLVDYPQYHIAINTGVSIRTAKLADDISSDLREYQNKLRVGYCIGGEAAYFISEQLGIGMKFDVFKASNSVRRIAVTLPNGGVEYGRMSDDITITFIGPYVSSRYSSLDKKGYLLMNMGLGYVGYEDKAVLIDPYTFSGSSVGLYWDMGYDYNVAENIALNIRLAYITGLLKQMEITDGTRTQTFDLDEGSYEGLGRVNLSVGIVVNF